MELPGDFPGKEKGQVWGLPGELGLVGGIWAQGVGTASVGSWVVTFGSRFGQECLVRKAQRRSLRGNG